LKRVLVTGGAGYLGSILVRELIKQNYIVWVLDGGLYGYESLKGICDHPNFESCLNMDIRDLTAMSEALVNVDHVVHLAGLVGMEATKLDSIEATEINYIATRTLAELCELREINFIFSSTCSIYGSNPGKMLTEKTKPSPQEEYAAFKLKCEKAILQEHSSPCIFRFGTLFGNSYRMRFDLVINLFIAQALNHEKLKVFGGGEQVRPFLHVKDAAAGIAFSIEKELDGIYNLISENHTLKQVAQIIAKMGTVDVELTLENPDKRDYAVSMEKFSNFGFMPKYNIPYAFNEIADQFDIEKIDYKLDKYSNVKSLKKN